MYITRKNKNNIYILYNFDNMNKSPMIFFFFKCNLMYF